MRIHNHREKMERRLFVWRDSSGTWIESRELHLHRLFRYSQDRLQGDLGRKKSPPEPVRIEVRRRHKTQERCSIQDDFFFLKTARSFCYCKVVVVLCLLLEVISVGMFFQDDFGRREACCLVHGVVVLTCTRVAVIHDQLCLFCFHTVEALPDEGSCVLCTLDQDKHNSMIFLCCSNKIHFAQSVVEPDTRFAAKMFDTTLLPWSVTAFSQPMVHLWM